MATLPTGEQLPEYDDEPAVNPVTLLAWLREHASNRWAGCSSPDCRACSADGHMVADVLQALQAVGGAQLVKNATYRAMVRDGRELERLGAAVARTGHADLLALRGPVDAAIDVLNAVAAASAVE